MFLMSIISTAAILTLLQQVSCQRTHLTLNSEALVGKRVFVLGDVHGCFEELINLLDKAEAIDRSDNTLLEDAVVILAGDFVNKGPYSLDVVRWLMNNAEAYAVTGNNENDLDEAWVDEASQEELDFIATAPWTIYVEPYNARVVHAGMMPNWKLEDQTEYIMTLMRNLEDDGEGGWIPHEETDDGDNWGEVYSRESTNPEFIIYGHDARRGHDEDGNIVIQEHDHATGLDTRCVSGGELTALKLIPPFRSYISVQCEEYNLYAE